MTNKDSKSVVKKRKNIKVDTNVSLNDLLYQKAIGFKTEDIVEEFIKGEDGELVLSKRKINIKQYPPDLNALELVINQQRENKNYENLTIEELEDEYKKIYAEIKNEVIKEINNGNIKSKSKS